MNARRTLWVLGLAVTTHFTAFSMALTLAPLMGVDLGASPAVIGLLTASLSLLPLLLAVRTGTLIDRIGSRRGLLAASLLLAVAPLAAVAHPAILTLLATEVLLGLANLLAVVAGQAFTGSIGRAAQREANMGWYTTFVSAGQVAGPLGAGLLADWHGYPLALGATAAVALAAFVATLALPRPPAAAGEGAEPGGPVAELGRARDLLAVSGVQLAVVFTFSISFAQSVYLAFFPVILQAAGVAAGTIGALLAARALVTTLLRPFLPAMVRWIGDRRRTLVAMVAVMAVSFAAIGAVPALLAAGLASLVVGVAWGLAPPLSVVMVIDGADPAELGFALGVRFTVNRLAQVLGPLAIGLVAEGLSLRAGFLAGSALIAASLGYLRTPAGKATRDRR